jgi:hypothetical protein
MHPKWAKKKNDYLCTVWHMIFLFNLKAMLVVSTKEIQRWVKNTSTLWKEKNCRKKWEQVRQLCYNGKAGY